MIKEKKIYIAGPISNYLNFYAKFETLELLLKEQGKKVMNPAKLGAGFEQQEYMDICYKMIDVCDAIVFLKDWRNSVGARKEYKYAEKLGIPCYEKTELGKYEIAKL